VTPARVIADPAAAIIEPGEILVARSTDPGWTPLFLNASGLVTEAGGRLSHGALVAREYGLPAVAAVSAATTSIGTGRSVQVDGGKGAVEVLD
jgi:pyruvate,water dikinase